MQQYLLSIFFEVSQWLLTPIIVLLAIVSTWLLLWLGATMREAIERYVLGRNWNLYVDAVRKRTASPDDWQRLAKFPLHRWIALRSRSMNDLPIFIQEAEMMAHHRLGQLQILIRTGPMLGLVGTLIPLGPALQGLSNSDFEAMGSHMTIAFTVTVFGILVGAIAYAIYIRHRSWSERDLTDLELICLLDQSGQAAIVKVADETKD